MNAEAFQGKTRNHELLAIADSITRLVQKSVIRASRAVSGDPRTKVPAAGIENAAFQILKSRQQKDRSAVRRLALARGLRTRGLPANALPASALLSTNRVQAPIYLDFESAETIVQQARSNKYFDGLRLSKGSLAGIAWDDRAKRLTLPSPDVFRKKIQAALEYKPLHPGDAPSSTSSPARPARTLSLMLDRLRALRRTGFEATELFFGDDEMYAGGAGVDSTEQILTAPPFFVNTFKKDGEDFNISPDKTFVRFNLDTAGPWPRAFSVSPFIAEKDLSEGFLEFLQALWDAIGDDVTQLATELTKFALLEAATLLAATGGGAIAGSALGNATAPLVGALVGAIVGAVLAGLVAFVLIEGRDDIFDSPEAPVTLYLPDPSSRFEGGNARSPSATLDFTYEQSRYILTYYWKLDS